MMSNRDRIALTTLLAAMCAVMATYPAPAQEGTPEGGGDAAPVSRDVEPFTPQRGPAGLQRRANLKALVAAPGRATGLPGAAGPARPLVRSGMDGAAQRNAIGVALPRTPAHGMTGAAAAAGGKPAHIGITAANTAGMTLHPPAPSAGSALHATGINGTTMGRMTAGPGFIGGPVKDRSGINGTSMPPKR